MPDISMCSNSKCKVSETCYRFKATANPYRQSYCGFSNDDNTKCSRYWEVKPKENSNG